MITVKITSGGKSTIQGTGKWSYAWINNAGETAIYATTEWGTQTVTERIAEYEAGGAKDIVKLPAGSSKRLRANNRPVIIFGAEAGMAEVDLTNTDVSPFKVQAKGGDDGKIESLSVTENGTYTASGEVKGYSPVSVNVQPNLGTKNISDNGTYTASADQLDGYSSVTVAVSKDFYPKAHATLDDASRVEGDDMRVYPMGGTDYYPYVYLGVKPYNTQEEYEPVGKYFAGRSIEYTASIFLDLIDVETGESATGYPQQVAPTQANFSIVSGGYCRIKAWSVTSDASQVSITIERFNPTYTKPIENTYTSVSVTPLDALQSYLNTSYYIDGGAGESVLLQSLTATANGTYTAPARTAYNEVVVDVQEQPWEPLEDGYSNFWLELTDDTLSPWLNFNSKTEDAVIDWGDGSGEVALDTLTPTHTYAKAGKYVVKVKGVTGINPIMSSPFTSAYMATIRAIEFNSDVTTLANYSLQCLTMLEHIKLSDSITDIGTACLRVCSNLADFTTNATLTTFPSNMFAYCVRLANVNLRNTIETITGSAFYYCLGLVSITIPASVTSIGAAAFQYCSSLSEIHVQATTPPTLGNNAFNYIATGYVIYVPVGTGETYKSASGWSAYADHILEEGQTPNRAMLSRLAKAVETDTDEDMR